MKYNIHSDIKKAETLPATFYKDSAVFEATKEKVFLNSWQWIGDEGLVPFTQSIHPFVLLDGYFIEEI
jgi:choline monooxygenase